MIIVGDEIILPSLSKLKKVNLDGALAKRMTGKKVIVTRIDEKRDYNDETRDYKAQIFFKFERGEWCIYKKDAILSKIDDWRKII